MSKVIRKATALIVGLSLAATLSACTDGDDPGNDDPDPNNTTTTQSNSVTTPVGPIPSTTSG